MGCAPTDVVQPASTVVQYRLLAATTSSWIFYNSLHKFLEAWYKLIETFGSATIDHFLLLSIIHKYP